MRFSNSCVQIDDPLNGAQAFCGRTASEMASTRNVEKRSERLHGNGSAIMKPIDVKTLSTFCWNLFVVIAFKLKLMDYLMESRRLWDTIAIYWHTLRRRKMGSRTASGE